MCPEGASTTGPLTSTGTCGAWEEPAIAVPALKSVIGKFPQATGK